MLEILNDYKKYFIIALILVIGGGAFLFYKSSNKPVEETIEPAKEVAIKDKEEEVKVVEEKYFNVDVKGAVKKPGVYSIKEGSIVNDVIKLAGLKKSGSTKNINLSKKVLDEMVIYVYSNSELKKMTEVKTEDCFTNEVYINECEGASIIVPGESSSTTPSGNETDTVSGKVNINKANKEQLMTLTGIGEAKAIAIINYRENNNGFKEISEIMNVSGIGESVYNKIKDSITI